MISIGFTIFGIFFNILLIIICFSKKRIELAENKFYNALIFITLISSITEVFNYFLVQNGETSDSFIYIISIKFLFLMFLLWLFTFLFYIILIGKRYSRQDAKTVFKIVPIIFIVSLIILLLPVKIVSTNGLLLPTGMCVNAIYILAAVSVLLMIITVIKNRQYIKNREYYPLYTMIFVFSIVVLCQRLNPELLLINPALLFITFLMYFTIENPDAKMIEELSKNRRIIENQNEDITNFLFRMTQDIKKPIKDLLEESKTTNKMESSYINNKIRELDYTVNDVLDVSGMSTSSLRIYENKYDIHKLLKEVRIKIENELPREIRLDYNVSRNVPKELYGDSIILKRIIVSLLDNAVKHTKEGYISLDVDAITKYDIARIIISVSDTGKGMGLEKINDILSHEISEEEYKVDSKKSIFNLNDIKHLMTSLDGSMIIKSEDKKGTTVSITINQKIVATKEREIAKKLELYEESLKIGRRIIVVDDDALELSKIKKIIESKGSSCYTSLYGREVIEKINKNNKYDLIILDDETNTHSAYEVFKELKKIKNFDIPVVIMIEDNKDFIKLHFLKDGFADVIMKSKLRKEVERVLDKKY